MSHAGRSNKRCGARFCLLGSRKSFSGAFWQAKAEELSGQRIWGPRIVVSMVLNEKSLPKSTQQVSSRLNLTGCFYWSTFAVETWNQNKGVISPVNPATAKGTFTGGNQNI